MSFDIVNAFFLPQSSYFITFMLCSWIFLVDGWLRGYVLMVIRLPYKIYIFFPSNRKHPVLSFEMPNLIEPPSQKQNERRYRCETKVGTIIFLLLINNIKKNCVLCNKIFKSRRYYIH